MKKILLIIIFIFLGLFLYSRFQHYQKQSNFDKSQKAQQEGDKIYSQKVLEESRKDPLFELLPVETAEFQIAPTLDIRYEYTVVSKISDKEKAKQAFLAWVQEKKLDISNLKIIYE